MHKTFPNLNRSGPEHVARNWPTLEVAVPQHDISHTAAK